MLLAAAQKSGAGLSTLGLAGCGLDIEVVFAGLSISMDFNPIDPTFCDPFIRNNIFNTGGTDFPTKIFSEVQLKDDIPSEIPEPCSKDRLDYALICIGTADIGLVVILCLQTFK
jgi:hypothetical protein